MAFVDCKPRVEAFITLRLSEEEAAALDALVGYGVDPFLKAFYQHMGEAYLKPHEAGLRTLFTSVLHGDASVRGFLTRAKDARAVIGGNQEGGNCHGNQMTIHYVLSQTQLSGPTERL